MTGTNIFIYENIPPHAPLGGVARYFRHISDGITTHFGPQATIFTSQQYNYGKARRIYALPKNFRGSQRLGVINVNNFLANWFATYQHASILYSPYYWNANKNISQVFTIYDMIYELKFPRTRNVQSFIAQKKRCIMQAELLLTISHTTAKDILEFYPQVDPKKLVTTWLGVDEVFFATQPGKNEETKPYFLYVGSRNGYKNFQRMIHAFGQSGLAKDFNLCVISPGGNDKFNREEVEILDSYNLWESVDLRLAVNETELRLSYSRAVALVYPSEYEGFGLPILEAMAAGTLVATGNVASMPEIAGDTAFYFDPHSTDLISEILQQITNLPNADRQTRIRQGIAHARGFTWERCQQQTVDAFIQLMSRKL